MDYNTLGQVVYIAAAFMELIIEFGTQQKKKVMQIITNLRQFIINAKWGI